MGAMEGRVKKEGLQVQLHDRGTYTTSTQSPAHGTRARTPTTADAQIPSIEAPLRTTADTHSFSVLHRSRRRSQNYTESLAPSGTATDGEQP